MMDVKRCKTVLYQNGRFAVSDMYFGILAFAMHIYAANLLVMH